ncbi:MAG: hypothetical protein ACLR02_08470 [Clostridium sp.]|nr:hypothetical protein [Clostridium sp.]
MSNNKSLNNIFIKIGISILLILLIVITLFSLFAWQKTKELLYIVIGVLCTLGVLFNIYLLLKEKLK